MIGLGGHYGSIQHFFFLQFDDRHEWISEDGDGDRIDVEWIDWRVMNW